MIYKKIIEGIMKFNSSMEDAFKGQIACNPDQIKEDVVIAPFWNPIMFTDTWESIIEIVKGQVWNIRTNELNFTYIKTGIGAPRIGDTTLALGVSACKRAIFIGSVGALEPDMGIGDLVIPTHSIAGDGYSRFLTDKEIKSLDSFGSKAYPDMILKDNILKATESLSEKSDVKFHHGSVFSTDTIFAQFAHIDEIIGYGCNCIEMETAAFFNASEVAGIKAGALLQVSDNTMINKSLYSGRTTEDQTYRKKVRREVFPLIINSVFSRN